MYQNNWNCNQVVFPSEVGEYTLDMEVLGCDQPWLLFYSLSKRWPLIIRGEAGGGRLDVGLVVGGSGVFRLLFWPVLLSPNHCRGLNHYPKALQKGRKINHQLSFQVRQTIPAQQKSLKSTNHGPWLVQLGNQDAIKAKSKRLLPWWEPVIQNYYKLHDIHTELGMGLIISQKNMKNTQKILLSNSINQSKPLIACSNGKNWRLIDAIRMNPMATK